jgi:hypothetical protein
LRAAEINRLVQVDWSRTRLPRGQLPETPWLLGGTGSQHRPVQLRRNHTRALHDDPDRSEPDAERICFTRCCKPFRRCRSGSMPSVRR